jgi:hypothetical protein
MEAARKIKDLKHEFDELGSRIPPLVREIWGKRSEQLVASLGPREAVLQKLIKEWEDAEHRLIAVANSLVSTSGQVRRLGRLGRTRLNAVHVE